MKWTSSKAEEKRIYQKERKSMEKNNAQFLVGKTGNLKDR